MDCPICKAPGMCICPPKQARVMNILTPAALEAAAKAMFETQQDEDEREYGSRDTWDQIHDSAKGYYLKYATIAFNAAIDRLIEEGRAGTADEITGPCILIRTGEP